MKLPFEFILGSKILNKFSQLDGEEFYLVGGCVRDLILGKPLIDVDILLKKRSKAFVKNVSLIFEPTSVFHWNNFLTSKLESTKVIVDFAQARGEEYEYPGKLPMVKACYDIDKDLKRRDFTINSMALELWPRTYRLIDPLGGYEDLKKKVIRVNKRDSFLDDPTRAFRAIKYKVRFNFSYDESTELEFEKVRISMPAISFQRLKNEIIRIVVEEKRVEMLKEVYERKLLFYWNSNFNSFNENLLERLGKALTFEERNWHFFLIPFGLENYFKDHKNEFTRKERHELELLLERGAPENLKFSELLKIFHSVEYDTLKVWALYQNIDLGFIESYFDRLLAIKPGISLKDLIKRVGNPEKARNLYMRLYCALLDGEISPGEEEIFLKRILKSSSGN